MKSVLMRAWWPEEGDSLDEAIDIHITRYGKEDFEDESADAAEQAAQYDYDSRDGHQRTGECQVIRILNPENLRVATYKILREFEPVFSVYDIV